MNKKVYIPNFLSDKPPCRTGSGVESHERDRKLFVDYRNTDLSRYITPFYEFNGLYIQHSPRPNMTEVVKRERKIKSGENSNNFLSFSSKAERRTVDDFYQACQQHRRQYQDTTGKEHPMDYFRGRESRWQCPGDMITMYISSPLVWVKYKSPAVMPTSLERTVTFPMLPDRSLVGVYSEQPDLSYKK